MSAVEQEMDALMQQSWRVFSGLPAVGYLLRELTIVQGGDQGKRDRKKERYGPLLFIAPSSGKQLSVHSCKHLVTINCIGIDASILQPQALQHFNHINAGCDPSDGIGIP